jgi:hypothetical protein
MNQTKIPAGKSKTKGPQIDYLFTFVKMIIYLPLPPPVIEAVEAN